MSTTSMMRQPRRCQFVKANGELCKNSTRNVTGFCQAHPDGRGSASAGGQLSRRETHSSKTMSIISGGSLNRYDDADAAPFAAQEEVVSAADRLADSLTHDLERRPRNKIRLKAGQWFDPHRAKLLSEAVDAHADLSLAKRGFDARVKEVDGWISSVSPSEERPLRGEDDRANGTVFDGRSAIGDLNESQIAEASRTRIDPGLVKAKFPNLYSQCCTGQDESAVISHSGINAEAVGNWKDTHCPNGEMGNRFLDGRGSPDDVEALTDYREELVEYTASVVAAQGRIKKAIRDTIPQDHYLIPSNRNPEKSVRVKASFKPGKFSPNLAGGRLSRRSLAQVTVVDLDPNVVRRIAPEVWERHQR